LFVSSIKWGGGGAGPAAGTGRLADRAKPRKGGGDLSPK
jgi:hypothetical protein